MVIIVTMHNFASFFVVHENKLHLVKEILTVVTARLFLYTNIYIKLSTFYLNFGGF